MDKCLVKIRAGRSSRLDADQQARLDKSGAKTGDVQIVLTWNNLDGTTLCLLVRFGRVSLTLCDVMQVVVMTWTFTSNLQKTNGSILRAPICLEEAIETLICKHMLIILLKTCSFRKRS